MGWYLLSALLGILGLAVWHRRADLRRMRSTLAVRQEHREGPAGAVLHEPQIDLSRCLGCGTCVAACPESGVLDLVHGQAQVVRGSRCVGHAVCEAECPVGAITVTVANLEERRDVPVLDGLEAVDVPGLILAGEVTAHALIKGAVDQGCAAAQLAAERSGEGDPTTLDLCIVGAGPAGLACALEARRLGLSFVVLDQEPTVGGTVAKYPRAKLVLTQPLELPLVGKLKRTTFSKEELIELWEDLVDRHDLPVHSGEVVERVEPKDGRFVVHRRRGAALVARTVCMAVGRRGVPRRLGVAGEELPKVAYSLLDAHGHRGEKVLVVGGGDSAVEAALALAEQPGNEVTLSYRRGAFVRIRERNEARLQRALAEGGLRVLLHSEVRSIHPDHVVLSVDANAAAASGNAAVACATEVALANDLVFVFAGGEPPVPLLEAAGVSFDPERRRPSSEGAEVEPGPDASLTRSLWIAFAATLLVGGFCFWHHDYYAGTAAERAAHPKHALLRSGFGIGVWFGVAATACVVVNLLYLARRRGWLRWGSLRGWMTSHVATGVLAVLFAVLHAALQPQATPGGQAFWALVVLLLTGAVGRWFYAWVPRATNGTELAGADARARLRDLAPSWKDTWGIDLEWDRWQRDLDQTQWERSFVGRLRGLWSDQRNLRARLGELQRAGQERGVPVEELARTRALAEQAHRSALMAARLEDFRALLATWRYVHRWGALLMVLLLVVHLVQVFGHGAFSFSLETLDWALDSGAVGTAGGGGR